MQSFQKFNKGLLKLPFGVQLWLFVLMCANMVAPLFFFDKIEAQVSVAVFIASAMLMVYLTARSGFSRLLGFGHVLWLPLIIFYWTRFDTAPINSLFGMWMRAVVLLNALSLILDAIDVVRFIRGDRQETVE